MTDKKTQIGDIIIKDNKMYKVINIIDPKKDDPNQEKILELKPF